MSNEYWNIPEGSRLSDSLPLPKCTVPTQNLVTIVSIVTMFHVGYISLALNLLEHSLPIVLTVLSRHCALR